jgi:hypothetical protein
MTQINWTQITTDDVIEAFGAAGIGIDRVEAAECLDAMLENGEAALDGLPVYLAGNKARLVASYLKALPGI